MLGTARRGRNFIPALSVVSTFIKCLLCQRNQGRVIMCSNPALRGWCGWLVLTQHSCRPNRAEFGAVSHETIAAN